MHTDEEVEEVVSKVQVSTSIVQLSQELLADRQSHWAERDAALQRLGELVQDGFLDPDNESEFGRSLKALMTGLSVQLPDLRSQVVRSACNTLALVCAEVGDHSYMERPLVTQVLPALVTLVCNGNKVLATAGRETLPTLVMYCHFDGVLKVLATELLESKQKAIAPLVLRLPPPCAPVLALQVLSAVGALLERAIVPAATDAAPEVRSLARQCLVHYGLGFPERSAAVESRLDAPTRALVNQEMEQAPPVSNEQRHVLTPAARRTTSKQSAQYLANKPTSRPASRPGGVIATSVQASLVRRAACQRRQPSDAESRKQNRTQGAAAAAAETQSHGGGKGGGNGGGKPQQPPLPPRSPMPPRPGDERDVGADPLSEGGSRAHRLRSAGAPRHH